MPLLLANHCLIEIWSVAKVITGVRKVFTFVLLDLEWRQKLKVDRLYIDI